MTREELPMLLSVVSDGQLVMWLVFVTILGACIGSFLNVLVYRMPAGQSLIKPPSTCPQCSHRLAWYDNVPVLGWLWLKGKCRYCRNPISPQYPIIEALTAGLFGGWFFLCYFTDSQPAFSGPGLTPTGFIFLAYLFLIGTTLPAMLIDARHFIIPLELPWTATAAALILIPAAVLAFPRQAVVVQPIESAMLDRETRLNSVPEQYRDAHQVRWLVRWKREGPAMISAAPLVGRRGVGTAFGGTIGLVIALLLLNRKIFKRSFADEAEFQQEQQRKHKAAGGNAGPAPTGPEQWLAYPHARREMLKETVFLLPIVLGMILGAVAAGSGEPFAHWVHTLGGVLLGYLLGGGIVWVVRILGTLGFGKEAMGLGDVHLLAAIGAVCGWQVAIVTFFLAPAFGLLWALAAYGFSKLWKRNVRMIPLGPHLGMAAFVVIVFLEPIMYGLGVYFGQFVRP